jgi:hypothetical protein
VRLKCAFAFHAVFIARIDALKSELAVIDEWDMVKFFKELPAFHPGCVF